MRFKAHCTTEGELDVYNGKATTDSFSDVTACLEGIVMTQDGKDRVKVTGVKGLPPPVTTKVGITAFGGYQAEFSVYICGL